MGLREAYIVVTLVMGGFVLVLTSTLMVRFRRTGRPLGRAFSYNLAGEFVASSVAVGFATLDLCGASNSLPPLLVSIMRAALFAGMLLSSLHMARVIRVIEND